MSLFSTAAFFSTGFAPVVSSFVAKDLGWRWINWIQFITNMVFMVIMGLTMKETRGNVLLIRKARALNKWLEEKELEGGEKEVMGGLRVRWKVRADEGRESLVTITKVSLTRPFCMF